MTALGNWGLEAMGAADRAAAAMVAAVPEKEVLEVPVEVVQAAAVEKVVGVPAEAA